MEELVPHKADLSTLQVIGQSQSRRKSQQKNDIEVHVHEKSHDNDQDYEAQITDNIQFDDDDKENELDDLPDVIDAPIMGRFPYQITKRLISLNFP